MSIANFVIFLILIFVPYSRFTNCCFIGGKNKSFYFPDPLSKTYFTFFSDYERKNPFTQRKGYIRYLTKLKEKKYLSSNTFNIAIANLDKINLMEIYYGISRGNIPLMHQSAISNKNNNSILGKNLDINLRQSLANSNKKETNEEILEKQKFFDSLFMSIFGKRNDQYETDYPIDYPMDTIEEENNESDKDNKEKFINDYNNPAGINKGLGPLPMDDNVYESVPLSKSKQINLLSKDKLKKKNTNDSYDISIKIKNNINRNKKYEDNLRNKNELESMKNDFDSESKEIPNMPFNASIQRSQNDNDMNTNYKNSSYKSISIDKNMQNNSINNMPINTSTNMMNNSDDDNNDNNNNSMEVKNNLIQGCLSSENEKKCLECDRYYVLDKEGDCVDNYYITDKEKQFYYYCKVLNEEGTGCAQCENGLNATEEGICYDDVHCEKNDEGVCTECQKDNSFGYFSYCLNEVFGCVDTFLQNCIRCDNVLDLDLCTECEEGYDIDENGDCVKKENL